MHCVPEDAKRKRGRCFRGRRCSLPDTIVGRNEFYSLIAMCDLDGMIMRPAPQQRCRGVLQKFNDMNCDLWSLKTLDMLR